jgi:Mce-associated membrane protein
VRTTTRATRILTSAILLLVVVLVAEGWYLWGSTAPEVSAAHPVVIGDVAAQSAAEQAAQGAAAIFTNSYRTYDGHVAHAAASMTPGFALQYRQTAKKVRAAVVRSRTVTRTRVAGVGVVTASPDQVEVLLFLDQHTRASRGRRGSATYRALVTMIHTDRGWLVGDVDTQ